jgi:hypothetical protein
MKSQVKDGSEIRPYRDVIGRRALPHDLPLFVDASKEIFFYNNLLQETWDKPALLSGGRISPISGNAILPTPGDMVCSCSSFDAGPCSFPRHFLDRCEDDERCCKLESRFDDPSNAFVRRFTSNHAKINWQRDFFDHRLRGDEGWHQKSDYILQNPVRAGLIAKYEEWPYVLLPAER